MRKFIFIGDSLTYGYGVYKEDCWVNKLSSRTKLTVINKGINGDTTASMLNRFFKDVTSKHPDCLFLMGGTNDLLCGRSIKSIIDNIYEMIQEALSIKTTIFIGIPPNISSEMANELFIPSDLYNYCENNLPLLRSELLNLCKNYNIMYIDFYTLCNKNLYKNIYLDGIHLNSLGNDIMFKEACKIFSL